MGQNLVNRSQAAMGRHSGRIGVLAFVLGTLMLAGCGGNGAGSSPAPQQLVSISVASSSGSIGVGGTVQFTATGHFSDNSTQDQTTQVTWSSSDVTIASISSSGVTTGLKPGGPVTITAAKGSVSGTASVKVTPATLVSITVTPANPSVAVGISEQFVATGKFTDGSTPNLTSSVTWASSSPAIATINSTGLTSDLKLGTTTISATQGSISSSTTLTVSVLVSISVLPANPSVTAGYAQQLTATGTFRDNSTPQNLTSSVTWGSSDTTIAAINSTGRASTLRQGRTNISATQGSVISSVTMTVTPNPNFAGVLTQHNDSSRTGQNLTEIALTPSSVNFNTFGKLFAQPVDGQIYAQPLYVPDVAIQGKGNHNVMLVATEGDSVYAFDADDNTGSNANPLWTASLIDTAHGATPGETTVHILTDLDPSCTDLIPQVGITSTPVIDPSTGTMYVEAKSKKADGTFVHRLHMLDITTGAEKSPGPQVISATVPGTGDGTTTITFNPLLNLNRPGLLLVNGTVYLAFGSHCDQSSYHGWMFAYNASTLAQTAVFITTPNGPVTNGQHEQGGGIWTSGGGVAADSNGNIFTAVGNGAFDSTDVGDSILRMVLNGNTISLSDYFTPFDQGLDDLHDYDVGSGGILLLPDQPGAHPHELVEATKSGTIYLIDRDQMTTNNQHYCSGCTSDPEIVQEFLNVGVPVWQFATPAYWNNTVYIWGSNDVLKAYTLTNGLLGRSPRSSSNNSFGFPGATPSISANGNTNGIVWVIDSTTQFGSGAPPPNPAVLHAYDATNVANEIWNSSEPPNDPDTAGKAVKFAVPTIANGKVYIGTSGEVDVYGIVP
jgi:Bacterial Ig-like domain (group 2)